MFWLISLFLLINAIVKYTNEYTKQPKNKEFITSFDDRIVENVIKLVHAIFNAVDFNSSLKNFSLLIKIPPSIVIS